MSALIKKTIKDIDVGGKRVLVRVDYNVPMKSRCVADDTRIKETLPTINDLLLKGAKVILMSHLGRPNGKVVDELRMAPVAERTAQLLNCPVKTLDNCVSESVEKHVLNMRRGEVVLLENLRFHKEEEANDPEFAKQLAHLGEIYVNDAFGTAHRAHASTCGIASYLPAVAGFLMEKELQILSSLLDNPKRPFYALLGGAKTSDKLPIIKHLISKVNEIFLGGAMAFTFLKAKGCEIGRSRFEPEMLNEVKEIMAEASKRGVEIHLPKDVVAAEKPEPAQKIINAPVEKIPENLMGLDIGPVTCQIYSQLLSQAGTIFWNGPMGVFEVEPFDAGTMAMAKTLANSNAETVVGGGDVVAALEKSGVSDKITHISTGGGASLEFLEGRTLPGIAVLLNKEAQVI